MKKLTDIRNIISRSKEGWSDSKIAEELNMSRNTVRKYRKQYWEIQEKINSNDPNIDLEEINTLLNSDPKYDSSNRKPYKYTKELDDLLEKILDEEEQKAKEQGKDYKKIPKTKMHQRVIEEGFKIGYTTISKKVDEKRLARNNMSPWNERKIPTK